jgi:hypothetical protein
MKHHHEAIADLHKIDGGMPMKHHHEQVEQFHKQQDGGMPMKHYHEEVAKLCGGGKVK